VRGDRLSGRVLFTMIESASLTCLGKLRIT
jgi:hypothetical protein